jgi:malate dehydrogenase (oxaloacetate-decarboxylating)(NADP+)
VLGRALPALACLDLLAQLGIRARNITGRDIDGVVYDGRTKLMDDTSARYAQSTVARTLADILPGADVFIGLSARAC